MLSDLNLLLRAIGEIIVFLFVALVSFLGWIAVAAFWFGGAVALSNIPGYGVFDCMIWPYYVSHYLVVQSQLVR